nr:MAG TPA: hypothetical protein [Caudoviricetes sp.]
MRFCVILRTCGNCTCRNAYFRFAGRNNSLTACFKLNIRTVLYGTNSSFWNRKFRFSRLINIKCQLSA